MNKVKYFESELIKLALEEDNVKNDITTGSLLDFDSIINAEVICKETGIISGTDTFRSVFLVLDHSLECNVLKNDGSMVKKGDKVIILKGLKSSILKGERTALNFLQRLSGIATLTDRFIKKLDSDEIKLLDTRKTTPGMRYLEKKAVRDGGGTNHRMDLEDMAMIKDNHIKMAGSIENSVRNVRFRYPEKKIELEVTNLNELSIALKLDVDIIMLDNFDIHLIKKAVTMKPDNIKYEISGNVTLENIKSKNIPGIDYISTGALTHSFRSLDLSLEILE
ncbi:MAG: carboxylating nicotinate-nucleotide diphosphorylase [Acidobacteriota bacterium]